MIITPIHTYSNINYTNRFPSNHSKVYIPTFQGATSDVNAMEAFNNAEKISELIDKNKFKEAYDLMCKIKDNFYPDYVDRKTKIPLLLKLARKQKNIFVKKSEKNSNYIREIMIKIITHKEFNPNMPIVLKDRKGNQYQTSYIEEAINGKNIDFALLIKQYMSGIDDPYNNNFCTLTENAIKSGSSVLSTLINDIAKDELEDGDDLIDQTLGEAEKDNNTEDIDENIKEEKSLLKQTNVTPGDDIPDSLDKIGGMAEAKKIIDTYIIKAWQPDKREQLKANHTPMPNGFLLYGPPGCGKTFITNIIAKQTGYPLYSVSISEIGSHYMGVVPRRLKHIFSALEKQYKENGEKTPSILFLDELDDMGVSRNGTSSPGKKEDLIALLTLTNNVGNKGIILIGATNYPDGIDKALLRKGRFDKLIKIELPSREERKDILKKLLETRPKAKHLLKDLDLLADKTEGKSPADIASYLNECVLSNIISDTQTPITTEDFTKLIDNANLSQKRKHIGFNQ